MPVTIQLGTPPQGIALNSTNVGEKTNVAWRDFSSSEDGDAFISRLEDYPSHILNLLPAEACARASIVDHFLFIIYSSGECTVYVNELKVVGRVRIRKEVSKGEKIFDDDILDIEELKFDGVDIPPDAGVFILISQGWRKGMYFDLGPLWNPPIPRDYDIHKLLGSYLNYLTFQQVFKIKDEDWALLFSSGWFPFIGLKSDTTREVLNHVRNGWDPDSIVNRIYDETKLRVDMFLIHWKKAPAMSLHKAVLEQAVERFVAQDFLSCVSLLYPRIEGLLRCIASIAGESSFGQKTLAEAPSKIRALEPNTYSRLLPQRFRQYLEQVFFAPFDPNSPKGATRHTVAHGVAPGEKFDRKSAVIAILMIEQIAYHLPPVHSEMQTGGGAT